MIHTYSILYFLYVIYFTTPSISCCYYWNNFCFLSPNICDENIFLSFINPMFSFGQIFKIIYIYIYCTILMKFDAIENLVGSANSVEAQMRKYSGMAFFSVCCCCGDTTIKMARKLEK